MNLETCISIIVSAVTACAAIVALFLTCRDSIISNKHFLFEKRVQIWSITKHLLLTYRKYELLLDFSDEKFPTDITYAWLCNNATLEEIQGAARQTEDPDEQRKFLLKYDELYYIAESVPFLFKYHAADVISEFLNAYIEVLNGIRVCCIWFNCNAKSLHEVPGYRPTADEIQVKKKNLIESSCLIKNIEVLKRCSTIMNEKYEASVE